MKRIAILYSNLSGYTAACQRALKERATAELLVVHWPIATEAPFDDGVYAHIDYRYTRDKHDTSSLMALVSDFQPDVVLMSGWMDSGYMATAKDQRKKGVLVIAGSDTQWTGSVRQRLACCVAPWYLHSAIDILWVTGERQRYLAEALGYSADRCWTGFYSCDWERFAGVERELGNKAFLYTGRLIDRKGIRSLLSAYRDYQLQVKEPWALWTAGTGLYSKQIGEAKGVVDYGFVQPDELPELMRKASAFVLPSLYEPWGVALHEAAAAGLPLLASEACGAGVHLLRDGFNGYTFRSGDSNDLCRKLIRLSELGEDALAQYGANSYSLSKQYTPKLWADTLINNLQWS